VDSIVKSEVRLKYSGLVIFSSKLISVATGLLFIVMVTRTVSKGEFGIWGNIHDIFNYFVLLAAVLPFWTTRFVAREHSGSAKTGLIANIFLSIISAAIYLALLPIILSVLQVGATYTILYTIISIQILEVYTTSALQAVLRVKQPQTIGYGLLVHEACKVTLGFAMIIHLKLGLLGAASSMIIAYFAQIVFYMKLTSNELRESIKWTYVKEWLKGSSINLYDIVGTRIAAFTLIFLFMYGEVARAYYEAAFTIANVIGYSAFLAYALYPRLLSESNTKDISISLRMVLMIAIPMTIGVMVLSNSFLVILESGYREARIILLLLAINFLGLSLSQVFDTVVMGSERIDIKAKIPFKQLAKTRLFQIFTLSYVKPAITLPTTFFALLHFAKNPLEAATYVALINLIVNSVMLLCRYVISHKCLAFNFPWKATGKYIIASSVMATLLFVVPNPNRILPTLVITGVGGVIYFATLAIIDHETRELMKSILEETRSKLGRT